MHRREGDTAALAALEPLSASWRHTLKRRLHAARQAEAGPGARSAGKQGHCD